MMSAFHTILPLLNKFTGSKILIETKQLYRPSKNHFGFFECGCFAFKDELLQELRKNTPMIAEIIGCL